MYQDYFTTEQHDFMIACKEVLEACGFDEDEAYFESKDALDDWEYTDVIPTSPDEMKYGKVSFEVRGKRATVFYTECHQWKAGQRHLRTHVRETYVSSRWYTCDVEGHKIFKVKLTLGNELACFQRAIHKVLNLCVTD